MFPLRRDMSSDEEVDSTSVPVNLLDQWVKKNNAKGKKCGCKKGKCSMRKHSEDKEWTPSGASPYFLKSKKRQNGDKTEAVTSKSKRTCLSNRGVPSEWKNLKKKNGVIDPSSHLDGGLKKISLGTDAPASHKSCRDTSCNKASYLPARGAYGKISPRSCQYDTDGGPSSSLGSSSSVSNDKPMEDSSLRHLSLTLPSTSRSGQESAIAAPEAEKPSSSKGITYFNSETDSEESKYFNGYPNKSGYQLPGCIRRMRKMFDKSARRILDSDSSDCELPLRYRHAGVPSDSDDSSNEPVWPKKSRFFRHNPARIDSSDSDEGGATNRPKPSSATTKRNPSKLKEKCPSCVASDAAGTSYSELNGNAHEKAPSSSHNRSGSPFLAIRSRLSRNKTSARMSTAPHPRFLGHQRRQGVTTRSAYNLRHPELQRRHMDIPNLFDAEDSSEVEFFTAHSYSDTETSTESAHVAQAKPPSSARLQHNSTIDVADSSDEEISVIFPIGSTNKSERNSRRGQSRGAGMRRRRSTPRSSTQESVSVSPDPVAQVRQVEEDEQYARMLQAEFDAELHEEPLDLMPQACTTTDSDESEIIDPVGLDSPSVPFAAHVMLPANPSVVIRGSTFGFRAIARPGGRRRAGRRSTSSDPWEMWQFARVLGLRAAPAHDNGDSEYEALIRLAEHVGEAIPHGLHKTDINRLPTRKFLQPGRASTSQASEEVVHKRTMLNKECQVCLCDYEHGDILRILPCFHEFHTPCIDPWLKINNTCPVCRVEVVFDS